MTPTALAGTDTIYVVQVGDTLSKIAKQFLGDANRYPEIAARNNIGADSIVYIGQRLVIPPAASSDVEEVEITARQLPVSPGGSAPAVYNGQTIETVTTTATRIKFWEDWRFWLVAGGAAFMLWYLSSKRK